MKTPEPRRVRFCASDELQEGAILSRWVEEHPVAVARHHGVLRAFGALCPHAQADLSTGMLEDDGITCTHHLWHFELSTGRCTMIPGARLPVFDVGEDGGEVFVALPPA